MKLLKSILIFAVFLILFFFASWAVINFFVPLKQSLWQTNFTISHDNYFDKDYASIEELKAQAEIVRAEIKK